jgi:hypothetical protein
MKAKLLQRLSPITETPAFKAWFQGSKVVDDGGNPLKVYHATNEDFDVFHPNSWFAIRPGEAKVGGTQEGTHILPVFLNVKSLYVLSPEEFDALRYASYSLEKTNNMGQKLLRKAKRLGHDGVLVPGYAYIVPNPNQIKSAIGNDGSFDPKSRSITSALLTRRD